MCQGDTKRYCPLTTSTLPITLRIMIVTYRYLRSAFLMVRLRHTRAQAPCLQMCPRQYSLHLNSNNLNNCSNLNRSS
jgi:hypothetical protein